ncbi:RHTO0S01e04962g1_1 [Rhodotorula toruloides]|uniref:RHTO0S01e04962g1_1 n=1 Tax=Rhodotorula toruloides TaxID=5286 RepID=A0A061ADT1_RHOTO|nr:RHTO0S01e04962g1_1 [Rhodotorula toruloides]
MGRLFGFTSLEELIGTLLPSEEGVRFGRTQPAREWKEAVLSVALRDWLTRLQQLSIDDFKARIEDLKTRVGRDKEKIRIPAFDMSFALFAQQLFGMQTPPANADPEQLGITYGRILVDVCAGATSQALNIQLTGMAALVGHCRQTGLVRRAASYSRLGRTWNRPSATASFCAASTLTSTSKGTRRAGVVRMYLSSICPVP